MLLTSMEAAIVILEHGINAAKPMATLTAVLESLIVETDAKGTLGICEARVHGRSIS